VAVAAAGTPVQVVATQTPCSRITFSVPSGNAGIAFVGNSKVSHSTGAGVIRELAQTATGAIDDQLTIESQDGANRLDASNYWMDVATSGDALYVTYWVGA
jgi:hypothetical protein